MSIFVISLKICYNIFVNIFYKEGGVILKRFIKYLVGWFINWIGEMDIEEKICFSIAAILGIVTAVILSISLSDVIGWIASIVVSVLSGIAVYTCGGGILSFVAIIIKCLIEQIKK